jgi:sulfur-carrier protein adenylyltransferase/sulfurtransferase
MLHGLFKRLMKMNAGVPEITPIELKARMDDGEALVLIDVRELREAAVADLPAFDEKLQIPTGEFHGQINDLDPTRAYVVYCRSGARSAWAVRLLMNRGFERVLNLEGGVLAWRQEVDPSLQAY